MKFFATALLASAVTAVTLEAEAEWKRPVAHEHSYYEPVTTYETKYKTVQEEKTRQVPKTVYDTKYRTETEKMLFHLPLAG